MDDRRGPPKRVTSIQVSTYGVPSCYKVSRIAIINDRMHRLPCACHSLRMALNKRGASVGITKRTAWRATERSKEKKRKRGKGAAGRVAQTTSVPIAQTHQKRSHPVRPEVAGSERKLVSQHAGRQAFEGKEKEQRCTAFHLPADGQTTEGSCPKTVDVVTNAQMIDYYYHE